MPVLPILFENYPGLLVAAFLSKTLPGNAQGNFGKTAMIEKISLDDSVTTRKEWIFTQIVQHCTPDALNGSVYNVLPAVKETTRLAIKMVYLSPLTYFQHGFGATQPCVDQRTIVYKILEKLAVVLPNLGKVAVSKKSKSKKKVNKSVESDTEEEDDDEEEDMDQGGQGRVDTKSGGSKKSKKKVVKSVESDTEEEEEEEDMDNGDQDLVDTNQDETPIVPQKACVECMFCTCQLITSYNEFRK
jgi:hypothetical protein